MGHRDFFRLLALLTGIFTFSLSAWGGPKTPQFDSSQAKVLGETIVFDANDSGEMASMTLAEYEALTGQSFLMQLTSFFDYKKTFEEVSSYLTKTLEAEFDVFLFINVDFESRYDERDYIPAQHMRVLQKTSSNQKVFERNADGVIVGFNPEVPGVASGTNAFTALDDLMPISSGAGHFPADPQPYVDTPTGIYRINHSKSRNQRYGKGMYHSMYFDLVYPGGRVSSLAVHGTDKGQYKNLGKQRSHGCVRTTQAQANDLYENLVLGDYYKDNLPDLDRTERLKSETRTSNGNLVYRRGIKALIILFYGYDPLDDLT